MSQEPIIDKSRIITKFHDPTINDLPNGVLFLVDKPLEWTSFDVVNKIRSSIKYGVGIKKIKVGHAGTLDPMATGLLLVCVGKYTKKIDLLTVKNKTYLAQLKFGYTTETYDSESDEILIDNDPKFDLDDLEAIIESFKGDQMQTPPIYSAVKLDGQTAYKVARRGGELKLKARPINISSIEIKESQHPYYTIEVTCSKGTYIRSLAHDIGQKTGSGAYLSALRRTAIESFDIGEALTVEEVVNYIDSLPQQ